MKRAKRFSSGDEVEYFGSAIKSSSEKDYEPIISNEKTGSTGGSEPEASKPTAKPAPKPASAKTQKAEANPPTKANAAKMDEAAAELKRESNRGAEKSTSKAEESSKSSGTYKGFDGKIHKKSESSKPDIGGAIGRGISGFFSSIRERGKKSNPEAYAKGGSVSSASNRADGIAQRGKTRGKMC
jgi:type IV secretory pathway VirB10-like protein